MTLTPPNDCATMQELRQQIDRIDRDLMDLLVTRARYIDRAIDLKIIENLPARTTDRVAQVIANARANAEQKGLDADLAEALWAPLIEWSIQREEVVLRARGHDGA